MFHRCQEKKGFTLVELLVVIGIIALLAAILLPVLAQATHAARAARCRSRERQIFQGARMYLNNFDEFFPVAWHEPEGATIDKVSYNRFLIHMACDTNIEFRDTSKAAELFDNTVSFWTDPAKGVSNYYFSPAAIFKLPTDGGSVNLAAATYNKHAQYTELTSNTPSTAMPMLAETSAAIPDLESDADVTDYPETKTGIPSSYKAGFVPDSATKDAFYGVAKSYQSWNAGTKTGTQTRFDFRHNGAINVIFLDGHVDSIKRTSGDKLGRLHEYWNTRYDGIP